MRLCEVTYNFRLRLMENDNHYMYIYLLLCGKGSNRKALFGRRENGEKRKKNLK